MSTQFFLFFIWMGGLILSPVSFAIETQILDNLQSPLLFSWRAATEPDLFPHEVRTFYPFTQARSLLFLGDGFDTTQSNAEHSLAEYVGQLVDDQARIYKTDITCPEKLHGQSSGNLIYYRLDHREPFPFESHQFDTIIMRKGLCFCNSVEESCAGLKYGSAQTRQFFSEVVRVLNRNNSRATVFLTGVFRARISQGPLSFEEEQNSISQIQEILSDLESQNQDLIFEMIYTDVPLPFLLNEVGVRFNRIRNLQGHFLSKEGSVQNTQSQKVRFFEGIRIRVKPKKQRFKQAIQSQFLETDKAIHFRGRETPESKLIRRMLEPPV